MKQKLLIIDLSNYIFRAFYGVKPLFTKENIQTNALHGLSSMLLDTIQKTHPSHVIIALDSKKRKKRSLIDENYKANRKDTPEELKKQIPLINEFLKLSNFCSLVSDGEEADDIIGTLVKKEKNKFNTIFIATGDKDLMQLVDDNVFVYDGMKKKLFNTEEVKNKFGVEPRQIIDYLAIVGDSSDNIPGIQGIGPKGAEKLLNEYDNLENIYKNIENIKSKSIKSKLLENKQNAFLSQTLATVNCEINLEYSLDHCTTEIKLSDALEKFLDKYELNYIKNKIHYSNKFI